MENLVWLAPVLAVIALLFAAYKISWVSKAGAGTDRMKEIAGSIAEGARAFLFAEYKILVIFVVVLFVLIAIFIKPLTAICFSEKQASSSNSFSRIPSAFLISSWRLWNSGA